MSLVRVEHDGEIAVILLDNPPVNASTRALRAGVLTALNALSADSGVTGVVIMGAGKNFISGSDLKEFSGPLAEPQLPVVIDAIEAAPFPVIAAISGAALGGGYELALGCDARIGSSDALVGLPEVKLGIIPGAGGTQRLPRLVGEAKAIELICKGSRIKAAQAHALGMIDALSEGDLRNDAVALARKMAGQKKPLEVKPVPTDPPALIEATIARALQSNRGVPAAKEAIYSVQRAAKMPFAATLAQERRVFQDLRLGAEASALRYQFFAEREAKRIPILAGANVHAVQHVGVIGAGTMGVGIATCFLNAGYRVTLIEINDAALENGMAKVVDGYQTQLSANRITSAQMADRVTRLSGSIDRTDLTMADLVIEAIVENLELKQTLFAELETIVGPNAVLATNTSYLGIDAIASQMVNPARLIGLHFFSPADRMRLLEVISGVQSDAAALATGFAVGRKLGKACVLAKSSEGFIGNRIYAAYRDQCEFMVEEGATPEQVDKALFDFGFALGPLAVSDMSGLDIAMARRQRLAPTRDPKARYVDIADRLCEAGRLGRKTGAGWYAYPEGSKGPQNDPKADAIIQQSRSDKGITPQRFSDADIVDRALGAIINEAALVIEEGIALRASDLDLVLVTGFGFPAYKGGPLYWAAHQHQQEIEEKISKVATATGYGFLGADVGKTLARVLAET